MCVFLSGGRSILSLFVCLFQGMPHKWYHGRTGVVWNVSKRAIGVEVYKKVGWRVFYLKELFFETGWQVISRK